MKPETYAYIKQWRSENKDLMHQYNRNFARKYYAWKAVSKVFNNILIHDVYPDYQRTKKMGRPKKL
jgi:hypothetical protein